MIFFLRPASFLICLLSVLVAFTQPKISSFTPLLGPAGTQVTLIGSGFSADTSKNFVYFGPVRATVISAASTQLKVIAPLGASNQPITVTSDGLTAYSITGFLVTFTGGDSVITGQSFGGNYNVAFNSIQGYVTYFLLPEDLDMDGKPDLIVGNENDFQVTILHNRSSPGKLLFDSICFPVPSRVTRQYATGDLDGDGKPDLVCSYNDDLNYIGIWRNTSLPGKISFATPFNLTTDTTYIQVTINDIDGDGKPDLLVNQFRLKELTIYRNISTVNNLQFGPPVKLNAFEAYDYRISDLNNDGHPDLLISNAGKDSIYTYINMSTPGNISFILSTEIPVLYPNFMVLADLNIDGKNDFVSTLGIHNLRVFENNSTGQNLSFSTSDYSVDPFSTLGLGDEADFNGDGKTDMLFYSTPGLIVFQNNSLGNQLSFRNYTNLIETPQVDVCKALDFDLDGKPDICYSNSPFSFVTFKRNRMGESAIISVSSLQSGAGDTVAIHGIQLEAVTAVSFGGVAAKSFSIIDSSLIRAVVSNASYLSDQIVINTSKTSDSIAGFQYLGPKISSFSPDRVLMGGSIEISGLHLTGTTSLTFGNTPAKSFSIQSDTLVNGVADTGSTGFVKLSTPKGTDSIGGFTFQQPALIDSFFPMSSIAYDYVTITGQHLSSTTEVWFGDVPAPFSIINDSLITAMVAEGASGSVTLYSGTVTSSKPGFTYLVACVWTGTVDSTWENTANWNCGILPGPTTVVMINSGTVVINSNSTIWSLNVGNSANVVVQAPSKLTILH